jgi:hypothetical protein
MEASSSCAAGLIVAAPCETLGTETLGGDWESVRAVSGWVAWVALVAWVAWAAWVGYPRRWLHMGGT